VTIDIGLFCFMTRTTWTLSLLFCLGFMGASGCDEAPPYPRSEVARPEGRKGTCIACSHEIPSVGADNLVTVGGIQFIVCSPECRSKAAKGGSDAHDHQH